MKPAYEPIILAIAPRQGHTHAELAQRFGTGALNIDAARIGTEHRTYSGSGSNLTKLMNHRPGDTGIGTWDGHTRHRVFEATGRFPSNVLLMHAEGCERTGTRLIHGSRIEKPSEPTPVSGYGGGLGGARPARGHGDADGMEDVESWSCVDGCPVKMLDEQSSGEDGGSASRFFYTAKSSRSEREYGLLGVIPCVKCGGLNTTEHPGDKGPVPCYRCSHPTVKSIAINRYLATLLLPPPVVAPRRILVPFAGVGSEMIGAMVAGWDEVVGIEREEAYIPIAKARLAWWAEHPDGVPEAPTAVELRARKEASLSASLFDFPTVSGSKL